MTNAEYLERINGFLEALHAADATYQSNIKAWGHENGPYKFKDKIKAPFNLYINYPYLHDKEVTIFKVEPVHINNYFWAWEVKATEGKDIHTWYEPMEIETS